LRKLVLCMSNFIVEVFVFFTAFFEPNIFFASLMHAIRQRIIVCNVIRNCKSRDHSWRLSLPPFAVLANCFFAILIKAPIYNPIHWPKKRDMNYTEIGSTITIIYNLRILKLIWMVWNDVFFLNKVFLSVFSPKI